MNHTGAEALAYGHELERLAVSVFDGAKLPDGWLRIRQATPQENDAGVDVVVELANGAAAHVQVKASAKLAKRFHRRHRGQPIGVAVLHERMPLEQIRARVRGAVADALVLVAMQRGAAHAA